VLQRILQTEPEILLPRLTVEANETHKLVAAFLVPYLVRHAWPKGPTSTPRRTSSPAWSSPTSALRAAGPERSEQVARLVRAELLAVSDERPSCVNHPTAWRRRLRPLRPSHLHRLHAARPWLAVSGLHRAGAKKTTVIRPFADPTDGIIGSTNPTPVVIAVVFVCVVVFFFTDFGQSSGMTTLEMWPYGVHILHQYYRLFTSMFLHYDLLHIASNMITLVIVGPAVEVMLGKLRFWRCSWWPASEATCSRTSSRRSTEECGRVRRHLRRDGRVRGPGPPAAQAHGPVVVLIAINLALGFTGNIEWQAHIGDCSSARHSRWVQLRIDAPLHGQ